MTTIDREDLKRQLKSLVESNDGTDPWDPIVRQRIVDRIDMILIKDPSLQDFLDELEGAEYQKFIDKTGDRYAAWFIGDDILVVRHGDNEHPDEYVVRHTLLNQLGEGNTAKEALQNMLDACRDYIKFLYWKSKGNFKRWPELEHVFLYIEHEGGIESWLADMDHEVNEWLEANPE